MLTIRKEQTEAMRRPLVEQRIVDLVAHVKQDFPEETRGQSDEELYDRIEETLKRAERYDITSDRDVYKYVNISMIYGIDFNEQDETDWTADYLTDQEVTNPTHRMDRLYSEVIRRLEAEERYAAVE